MALAVYAALRSPPTIRPGKAWPSHKTIAELAQVSPSGVGKYLNTLRDAGWITWVERRKTDGGQTSNITASTGHPVTARHHPYRQKQILPVNTDYPSDTDELGSWAGSVRTEFRDPSRARGRPLPEPEIDEETQALLDLPRRKAVPHIADLIGANGSAPERGCGTGRADASRRANASRLVGDRWCQQDGLAFQRHVPVETSQNR